MHPLHPLYVDCVTFYSSYYFTWLPKVSAAVLYLYYNVSGRHLENYLGHGAY